MRVIKLILLFDGYRAGTFVFCVYITIDRSPRTKRRDTLNNECVILKKHIQ